MNLRIRLEAAAVGRAQAALLRVDDPETYMKDYSGKNALIRFELWKRYRDDANVSVRASWRECAPGRCDALYYNHTDDRVPPELYRAEAMRHRFCVVAPGDTPAEEARGDDRFCGARRLLARPLRRDGPPAVCAQIDYSRIALLLDTSRRASGASTR